MAGIMASASKGVIDSVIAKLNELMTGGMCSSNLIGVCSMGIQFLWNELSTMKALLEKLEDADELDQQAKDWRNQVREMTYDIEDCIDEFTSNVESGDAKAGFMNNISNFLKTLRSRVKTAWQIKDLKTRLQEINERHKRYKIEERPSSTMTRVDPRLSALYNEATSLVGIENPKEELLGVMDKGHQFKVVSIVGFGGLGKTTLVNEVYREVGRHFNSKAFVSISQNPDMARILKCILSQLEPHGSFHACAVQDLINNLREHLHDKRYIIVIDDLWDMRAWNIISCAFPQDNNQRSIVIITTRNEDVARACCSDHTCIYNMKPLSEEDSRKLFSNRVFRSNRRAIPSKFIEVSCELLKRSRGLPLAIITVASTFACQPNKLMDQYEKIHNSLAIKFATDSNFEEMMHILDLSYKNLPHYLKSCFLYLGTYPEDHKISKLDLVRKWVAEGFVSNSGQDVWDVAESYFYELVNRSMVQPAYEDDGNTMISYCRVHDMMHELIIRRCREENFISLIHDQQVIAERQDKVIRRLTVSSSSGDDSTMVRTHLSQVRSLAIFGGSNWIPLLQQEVKFVRVLFLDIYRHEMKMDLSCISRLAQLRYLKVKNERSFGDISIELPGQIHRLRFLETVELPPLSACRIPSDIVHLPRLSHLVVPHGTELPGRIGMVKSLRTLDGFNLPTDSSESIFHLMKLTNLTDLSLHCHTDSFKYTMFFPDGLGMLYNLRNLSLSCTFVGSEANALASALIPLVKLELLDLSGCTFDRIPSISWVLRQLRQLRLGVRQILQEDIIMLGTKLHYLLQLQLRMPGALTEGVVISGTTGFARLEVFELECGRISHLTFEVGAMPSLRKLWLALDPSAWDKVTPAGLQHLSSLKQIYVLTVHSSTTSGSEAPTTSMSETAVIRSVFQEAADAHPGRPAFTLGEEWLIRAMESWRTL